MKYAASLLALATVAVAAPAATTLPQLGGVNTAGYDFTVVCILCLLLATTSYSCRTDCSGYRWELHRHWYVVFVNSYGIIILMIYMIFARGYPSSRAVHPLCG